MYPYIGANSTLLFPISLFEAMKYDHVKRDSITYISVLSICSHGGLVDIGKRYFEETKEHKIEPTQKHVLCMYG